MAERAPLLIAARWLLPAMATRLAEAGLAGDDAHAMAQALVETSLMGIDSHGIRLFPLYLRELAEGRARPDPRYAMERIAPALARLDGDGGPGVLVGLRAASLAADIAEAQGLGLVLAHNSNHFGAASIYALDIARRGKLALVMTSAASRVAADAGGPPVLGTNPICFAAPRAGDHPFIFDMATSQVAYCRIKAAVAAGEPLPAGWCRDAAGADCADSGAPAFALQPLGGYKGQGLGLMVSMLTAMLAGDPADWDMTHLDRAPFDTPRGVAHFLLAIDPAIAGGGAIGALVADYLHAYRVAAGPHLQLAGEREWASHAERSRDGIPLSASEAEALAQCLGPLAEGLMEDA